MNISKELHLPGYGNSCRYGIRFPEQGRRCFIFLFINGQLECITGISFSQGSNLNKYTYLSILVLVQIVSSENSEEVLRLLVRIIDRGSYFIAHMAMLALEG